jgi:ABC-type branched-subunit amino acid transport system substrate-binding protein
LLAAAEINDQGGVLGRPVEIAARDCGVTTSSAIDAVDDLISAEGAEVIIGGHPSNLRDAVSARVSGKAPYIYTAQYEGVVCGPSTVAIGSTDGELIGPALNWLKERKNAERFFFIGNDYIWPRLAFEAARGLVHKFGGRWMGEAFIPTERGIDGDLLRRVAGSGAQILILALVGQSSIEFNRAFAAAGLDEKMLRFGLIVDETVICGIGAEASVNLYTAAHYFAGHRSGPNENFLERYHDAFGEWAPPVSAASVFYYEGLKFVTRLARELGTVRSRDLAKFLDRPMSPRVIRGMWGEKPLGQRPSVLIAAAQGAALEVVAEFAA